jgi:hypothetical protein
MEWAGRPSISGRHPFKHLAAILLEEVLANTRFVGIEGAQEGNVPLLREVHTSSFAHGYLELKGAVETGLKSCR